MDGGDFYGTEKSAVIGQAGNVSIEWFGKDGSHTVLKPKTALLAGEMIDAAVMSKRALASFIDAQIADAKKQGVLFSLHLKCTMMKVSDPIMFGVVSASSADVLEKHAAVLKQIGANPNNGIGDLYAQIASLPEAKKAEIEADIAACYEQRPGLAMVDSRQGQDQPACSQRRDHRRIDAGGDP